MMHSSSTFLKHFKNTTILALLVVFSFPAYGMDEENNESLPPFPLVPPASSNGSEYVLPVGTGISERQKRDRSEFSKEANGLSAFCLQLTPVNNNH